MHSSRMPTAHSSSCQGEGGSPPGPPLEQAPPGSRPPRAGTPRDQTPPWSRHPPGPDTLWSRHSPGAGTPPEQAPPRDQTPPVNRIKDTCKNITFPQLRLRAVIKTMWSIRKGKGTVSVNVHGSQVWYNVALPNHKGQGLRPSSCFRRCNISNWVCDRPGGCLIAISGHELDRK